MGCVTAGQTRPLDLTVDSVALSKNGDCAQVALTVKSNGSSGYLLNHATFPNISLVSTHPPQDHIRLSYVSFMFDAFFFEYFPLALVKMSHRESIRVILNIPLPFIPRPDSDGYDAPRPLARSPRLTNMPLYLRVTIAWIPQELVSESDRESRTIDRGKALVLQKIIETDDILIESSLPTSPRVTCTEGPSSDYTRAILTRWDH